ncbi:Zinc finger CCCH domain-containing protein 62 [Sesamum alatum]|uniref:Zinc finger CCCH domain-containing protein 62 n=1 Tax=Sesamum alatum TaxID=300844 RepID=A0AAE2CBM1_9LAMI|nr:Zinc finger CCCH domain-containing protein 62 [Sesamum alatum]
MPHEKSKKRNFIEISSSEESESSLRESDDDAVEEISSSTSWNDDDDEDDDDGSEWNNSEDDEAVDEDEKCDYAYVDKDDEEAMCRKVIQFIRGGSDLQELKLVECKAYLRKHSLRVSGSKEECIERIKEHLRLKDGNGEAFYPRSSFTIDCTGDVCKGDVVLFNQKVYQNFDKMTRRGSHSGRRTVAGRIVKESYGVARQQHTFTVEVLWSRGTKKLAPLYPLLVKGRNLYKLKTFRQRWKNEKGRLEVLAEKHKRGAAARTIRAMRKAKAEMNTDKSIRHKGAKKSKHFHHLGPSGARETTQMKKNCINEYGKTLPKKKKQSPRRNFTPFQTSSSRKNGHLRGPASHRTSQNLIQTNQGREPPVLPYNYPSQPFYHFQSNILPRDHFPSHRASASTARLPYSHPLPNSVLNPVPECQEFWHGSFVDTAYSHSKHVYEPRKFNHFPRLMDNHPSYYASPTDRHRWR